MKYLQTLSVLALMVSGGMALAESKAGDAPEEAVAAAPIAGMPAQYQGIPESKALGDIAGYEAWGAKDQQILFMRDKATGNLIVGFPYDAAGNSLNPDIPDAKIDVLLANLFATQINIPEDYQADVEARLAALDETARKAAVDALIVQLRGVEGEEAFNAAVEKWLATLPEAAADDPTIAATQTPVDAPAAAEGSEQDGPSLMDGMRSGAYVEIGNPEAPAAYVFMDPNCEPCLKSLGLLAEKVEAGELRLRALMLPGVNEDSIGVIAGVMQHDDPAAYLMELAITDKPELPYARTSTMIEPVRDGIQTNFEIAKQYELPQLPFFAFETEKGPIYINGAPSLEQIADIIATAADAVKPVIDTDAPAPEATEPQAPVAE